MTGMTLARPRSLAIAISASPCPMTTGWPVTPAVPATSYRHSSALDLRHLSHNSIVRTDVPAAAGRGGFAAKQAAPPRGVPR